MRKIFITVIMTIGFITISNANTIEIDNNETKELQLEKCNSLEFKNINQYNFIDLHLGNLLEQLSFCAQVQIDVKESYTEQFGPDRANSIALGAFMGCMGYL